MNLKGMGEIMQTQAVWVSLHFHSNTCKAERPAETFGSDFLFLLHIIWARFTCSCIGFRHQSDVTALCFIIVQCQHEVRQSRSRGEQQEEKYSEYPVRWINEERVMKGLQWTFKHRKSSKEQWGVGFNWKEASSHLCRNGTSSFDVVVSNCQDYILMVTR